MSTVIPGLLQLGGGHQTFPSVQGWLYLSREREWTYDSGVRVSPRWSRYASLCWCRNSTYHGRQTEDSQPCEVEDNVDYVGQQLDSLNTNSLADCLAACVSNSVCRGISLTGEQCSLKYSMKHRYWSNEQGKHFLHSSH